mmetsp:Transcript_38724/g.61350  ORF Transcript_38724/g.61350 Transcript_38724/m.61350 type:complete len:307 (-) Transcript_38724:60-980(-)
MFTLNTGSKMPAVGLGTWKAGMGEVGAAIRSAIAMGYRHIDCASVYQNQKEIGAALTAVFREKLVSREELFITSKLWCEDTDPTDIETALQTTLRDLCLEYLDLYLIHWPVNTRGGTPMAAGEPQPSISDTWKAVCALPKERVKSCGVSNFSIAHLQKIVAETQHVPAVNQVEAHPYLRQTQLIEYCTSMGIHVSAYCPLCRGVSTSAGHELPPLLSHPAVAGVAEECGRTPAQVVLAWNVQRGCSVLPKSVNPQRLQENLHCADCSLSESQMSALSAIEPQSRLVQGGMFTRPDGWYPTPADIWK